MKEQKFLPKHTRSRTMYHSHLTVEKSEPQKGKLVSQCSDLQMKQPKSYIFWLQGESFNNTVKLEERYCHVETARLSIPVPSLWEESQKRGSDRGKRPHGSTTLWSLTSTPTWARMKETRTYQSVRGIIIFS